MRTLWQWLRTHWPSSVAGLLFVWPILSRIIGKAVQWASTFDFALERFYNPSWIGDVLRFIADPPSAVVWCAVLIGLGLIFWDFSWWRKHGASTSLPVALG